jgi:hypothetical protein
MEASRILGWVGGIKAQNTEACVHILLYAHILSLIYHLLKPKATRYGETYGIQDDLILISNG